MAGFKCTALLVAVQCALLLSLAGAAPVPEHANAKASAVPAWSEHDSADYEHACLRATTLKQCQIVGLLSALYFEEGLECCNSDRHSPDNLEMVGGFPALTVGKCAWTFSPFLLPLLDLAGIDIFPPAGNTGATTQIGTYSVQCDLNQGSEECHEGLCDDMTLQSSGPMYWVPNSYLKSLPELTSTEPQCQILQRFLDRLHTANPGGKAAAGSFESLLQNITQAYANLLPHKPSPQQERQVKTASATYKRQQTPQTYTQGITVVTSGPVSIFSKHTNLKYKEGFLQAVPIYIPTGTPGTAVPGPDSFVVEPYRYSLKLRKEAGY